jgi:hypothetical protein
MISSACAAGAAGELETDVLCACIKDAAKESSVKGSQ